jgi:rSAM/selenodomain-associated transferase 1
LHRRVLGLFAKEPRPGQVKTRLAASTSPAFAAAVAAAFLHDLVKRLGSLPVERVLAFAPETAHAYFADLVQGRFQLTPQRGGDLGPRMAAFIADQLAPGPSAVVLIGTDSPTVPLAFIEQAFTDLEEADLVLGPATDGGYYLVGCAGSLPPIFHDISWGTSQVLGDTIARLAATPLRLALLPPWYDVDTLDDWIMLRGHLAALRRAGLDPGLAHVETLLRSV